ncbi:DUF2848 family protein [Mycobacterium sp. M23085]|uniref:DUF2848 family protein n=1 Tax=Mycobacterium sp. M23085 TaxID=3378087 RepID=UPI0038779B78
MTTTETGRIVLHPVGTNVPLVLSDYRSIVAGYTGRDEQQVRHHIEELAAIGVSPPPQVPMFYRIPGTAVTTASSLRVDGDNTSGEIEPVLIRHDGRNYLGVGSDHTDRTLETVDVGDSKRACPKPIGIDVVEIADWSSFDWDNCRARCWVDGNLYQDGTLAALRRPAALLGILYKQHPDFAVGDFVCLAGTVPLKDGEFVAGRQWELELVLADGRELRHIYLIEKDN